MNRGAETFASTAQALDDVFITDALKHRPPKRAKYRREKRALQELAACMADFPEDVLPHFVDLAMELTGAVSAGLSLYDADAAPDIFRWKCLRGLLAPFENATTPRNDSPCGVTLDRNAPLLAAHPERMYEWIAAENLVIPEVLLVPLLAGDAGALGTLWVVSESEGHFDSGDARVTSELAEFVGIALRMRSGKERLQRELDEQETLAREMSHRLKNIFAVTEGMIRISAKSADSPEALAHSLSGRVHALASAHSLVRRKVSEIGSAPRSVDLEALIHAIVEAHEIGDEGGSAFSVEGHKLNCGDHATNGIALIIHELATNASKYGALKEKDGRVAISWREEDGMLVLKWQERGGPPISEAPTAIGFGSTLVQRTVTGQFRGSLERDWRSEGLLATMRLRLDQLSA